MKFILVRIYMNHRLKRQMLALSTSEPELWVHKTKLHTENGRTSLRHNMVRKEHRCKASLSSLSLGQNSFCNWWKKRQPFKVPRVGLFLQLIYLCLLKNACEPNEKFHFSGTQYLISFSFTISVIFISFQK